MDTIRKLTADHLAAEVCLYGTPDVGYGYIAVTADGFGHGNGETNMAWDANTAMWLGVAAALGDKKASGIVRVFVPGGRMMADMDLASPTTYARLGWRPAPTYSISYEDLWSPRKSGSHDPMCPYYHGGECLCWRNDPASNPELPRDEPGLGPMTIGVVLASKAKNGRKLTFQQWRDKVDKAVRAKCGVSLSDLPDCSYRHWFDDDITAQEAADMALEEAGYDPED